MILILEKKKKIKKLFQALHGRTIAQQLFAINFYRNPAKKIFSFTCMTMYLANKYICHTLTIFKHKTHVNFLACNKTFVPMTSYIICKHRGPHLDEFMFFIPPLQPVIGQLTGLEESTDC